MSEAKRYCCFLSSNGDGCESLAEWVIVPAGAKHRHDSYTDACSAHSEELGALEGEARRISEGTDWLMPTLEECR